MKYTLLYLILFIICSCNKSKNNEIDESKITQTEISKILDSNITNDEKYKKIFIDKDFYNSDLKDVEITKAGQYFCERKASRNFNVALIDVVIDDNNMLQLNVEGEVKLNFKKNFDKYWLKVSTYVVFENKSFLSDTMIYELSDFDNDGVRFDVLAPIDNRFSSILSKEKYVHLDSDYLKHKPKETHCTVTLRASNNIGDDYEIPILFTNFNVQWERIDITNDNSSTLKKDIVSEKNDIEITKRIQFLWCSNGGYNAYFDDGTISGCARCECPEGDYIRVSDLNFTKYKILPNGNLEDEEGDITIPIKPKQDDYDGWVIINYVRQL